MKRNALMLTIIVVLLYSLLCCSYAEEVWLCPNCGKEAKGNFCSNCGSPQQDDIDFGDADDEGLKAYIPSDDIWGKSISEVKKIIPQTFESCEIGKAQGLRLSKLDIESYAMDAYYVFGQGKGTGLSKIVYLLSGNKHPTREINACLDDLIEAMKSAIGNPDSQKSAVATWEKESYSVQVGKGKFKNYTGTDSASVGIVFKYKGSDDEQGTTAQNGNKDYKLVKAYAWNRYGSYYEGLVIENRSGETKVFDAQVMFYDAQDSLIGVGNYSTDVVGNGKRAIIICSNEEPFHHLEYTITPNDTRYSEVQSFVNVQQKIKGGKVIIMATNNGDVATEYVEYHCLFINKNKKVVGTAWGYLVDDDSEIKPGKTEYREESCSEPFQTVEIYYTGRYE